MRITTKIPKDWKDLQESVAKILNECGINSEVEKEVSTVRGNVEIDVYAIDKSYVPKSVFICECKNWKTNIPQEKVYALNTVVQNIGGNFALLISKNGFQPGAIEASKNTNITLLTWEEFQDLYKKKWIESMLIRYKLKFESLFTLVCEYKINHVDIENEISDEDKLAVAFLEGICMGSISKYKGAVKDSDAFVKQVEVESVKSYHEYFHNQDNFINEAETLLENIYSKRKINSCASWKYYDEMYN